VARDHEIFYGVSGGCKGFAKRFRGAIFQTLIETRKGVVVTVERTNCATCKRCFGFIVTEIENHFTSFFVTSGDMHIDSELVHIAFDVARIKVAELTSKLESSFPSFCLCLARVEFQLQRVIGKPETMDAIKFFKRTIT